MNVSRWWVYGRLGGFAVLGCLAASTSNCGGAQSKYLGTPLDQTGHPVAPEQKDGGIVVSGEEWEDMSSPLFGAVEVTFENRSQQWVHLKTTSIRFGSDAVDQAIFLPAGDDLWAWQQATLRRNALRGGYRRPLAGAWGAGVMTSPLSARGAAVPAAGRLAALPKIGTLLQDDAAAPNTCAATGDLFPSGYLLGDIISVPPGLFAKRWILFYTPESRTTGCLRQLQLGYRTDDDQEKYVRLPFRDQYSRSEWQGAACRAGNGQMVWGQSSP